MSASNKEVDAEPFSAASITAKIFQVSLTRTGACAQIALAGAVSFWLQPSAPLLIHALASICYALVIWFALFLICLCAALGDVVAAFVMDKVFAKVVLPQSVRKFLYFALSLCGFAVAAFFVGLGDSPIERYFDDIGQR